MAETSLLALAERVAVAAQTLGIETALIGASALAAHNYVRGTDDVDLATDVDPGTKLRALEKALHALGIHAELRMPDAEDVLGGVLQVWEREEVVEDEFGRDEVCRLDVVEVVNFFNPLQPKKHPATMALKNAVILEQGSVLRFVQLPDLVALKLYAGGRRDLADVAELLAKNPQTDLDKVREVAQPYDRSNELETLIAEASARRGSRR